MYFVYLLIHYTHHNLPLFGQNGRHAVDDISKYAFKNEKFCDLTWISQEFVPQGPIDTYFHCSK